MFDFVLNFLMHGVAHASWVAKLVYFFVVTQLTIFSVTLYLHRSQSHRGVDFHPVLAHFFRFWSWLSTGMVTKEWVAIHRKHHAKCETEEDPHSPKVFGIKTVLLQGVDLYRVASLDKSTIEKYGHGTPDDWLERNVYANHEILGPTLLFIINIALFGIWGVAISALQMIWIPFWAAGVVNGLGHWWGYRNFETADMSTNLTPWGFFIGGEELHNNHHAFPSSAKFALRKFEFDIGWAVIRGCEKLGLAKVMRVAPCLDVRPNVSLPDAETLKALLTHRFQVMTDYFRGVIAPTLRDEAANAGASLKALPRRLRKALANGGRWLDERSRERMREVVEQRPLLATVCDFRTRLAAVLERGNGGAEAMLASLQDWCREAEATRIRALQDFAARLRGYALAPLFLVGLLFTSSRGAIIGSALGIIALLALRGLGSWRRTAVASVALSAIVLIGFNAVPPNVLARVQAISTASDRVTGAGSSIEQSTAYNLAIRKAYRDDALRIVRENPLLGVGTGNYHAGTGPTISIDPHNVLLRTAAEGGVPDTVAFIFMIGGTGLLLVKRLRRNPWAGAAIAIQVSTLTHATVDVYFTRGIPVLSWLLVGMALNPKLDNTEKQ